MDLRCKRCGYSWVAKYDRKPKTCPGCRSPYWDKELSPYWASVRKNNKEGQINKKINEMVSHIFDSQYFVAASGCRDVGKDELFDILKILVTCQGKDAIDALNELYEKHPSTIALNNGFNQ